MANRVIRDWTDSEKMDLLSFQAEVLFMRLTMKADDFGSFHANVKLVKAALFPLKMDTVRVADISRWMDELQKAGLVVFYTAESKSFLRIVNFGQRLRSMKKRFPDMPDDNSPQSAATCRDLRPEEKRNRKEIEAEVEEESATVNKFSSENTIDSFLEKELMDCAKSYFLSPSYSRAIELLCMNHQVEAGTVNQLKHLSVAFNDHCALTGKVKRSLKEWAEHFKNWLLDPNRKKITNERKSESIEDRRARLIREAQERNTTNAQSG